MATIDYNKVQYGSARFATPEDIHRAGLHTVSSGLFLGFDQAGYLVRSQTQAPVLIIGGARSGKNNHVIPFLTDGSNQSHVIAMDWKGQLAQVAQLKIDPTVRVINFAPRGSTLKTHKINPTSFIDINEPTFIADVKKWVESWITIAQDDKNEFFKLQARRWLEACATHYCELHGTLDLPGFAEIMFHFASDADIWRVFEASMEIESKSPTVRATAEELLRARTSDSPEAGGFQGSKNDIANSFTFLTDPQIMEQISPPYDFDIKELTDPACPRTELYIQENMEFKDISSVIVRTIYAGAFICKRRATAKRLKVKPQIWVMDEIGNIGAWELAIELATYAAGFGIRTIYVSQSFIQLDNLGTNARRTITQSCGTQIFKGIRDIEEAEIVEKILGSATIRATDMRKDLEAEDKIREAYTDSAFGDGDEILAGLEMQTYAERIGLTAPQQRALMTSSEVMFMDKQLCISVMPGEVPAPMLLNVPPYYTRPDLRGRYLGDPEHDEPGSVSIADGNGGSIKVRVIEERVPDNRKHLPQYGDSWHYVEGFRPDRLM